MPVLVDCRATEDILKAFQVIEHQDKQPSFLHSSQCRLYGQGQTFVVQAARLQATITR